jgi:hypothetical protein
MGDILHLFCEHQKMIDALRQDAHYRLRTPRSRRCERALDTSKESYLMPNLPASYFTRPVSMRARLLAPAGIAAAALFRGLPAMAQTPEASNDAAALLKTAATTMTALETFHFVLSTQNGTTQFYEGLELTGVEGDVKRPDMFRASAKVKLVVAELTIKMLSVGGRVWITDPTSNDDRFIDVGDMGVGGFDPATLINPDRLILPAIDAIDNPTIAGTESIDGEDMTRIDGTVNLKDTLQMAGSDAPDWILAIPDSMPLSVWIDSENRVRRVQVTGPILQTEANDLIRQIDFSNFNEPVDIQAPSS